jgi:DNA-binding winged helix-turn-helix (wHTH) protein/tetratricopeptide (TPR) repeat protein
MKEEQVASYEFGPYRLLPSERLLLRDGKVVPLTPKVFDTLLVFIRHRGQLLSKDELMKLIWRDTIVEEGNLTQNIFILRRILGESPHDHQYLVTIPQQGYRFVAKVKETHEAESEARGAAGEVGGQTENALVRSIAVLPFTMLNDPPDGDFGGLGLADTLITKLSNIRQLLVRPTSAVLKYRSDKEDLLAIGRELQVDAILDGSIQRLGNYIRVNVRLVRVPSGLALWAGNFDDEFKDIFYVQDSIAEQVVGALELKLSGEERRRLARSYTDNVEAYQLYVKGRYYWDQRTEQGLLKAADYVRRALQLDANYAPAYIGLADTYALLGEYLYLSPAEAFPPSKIAAQKALEIDSYMAEAHASLAEVAFFYEWNWSEAEMNFRRAVELKPEYASGRHWYAWFLLAMDRLEEATECLKQAQKHDPGSLMLNTVLGLPFYYSRQYERAIAQYLETLEMNPDFLQARYYMAAALTQLGRYEEAIAEYQKVISVEYAQQTSALLGYTYAISGQEDKAREMLKWLRELSEKRYVSPYLEALVYAGLGDNGAALAKLKSACQGRAAWTVFLNIDPFLDSLRSDPRFLDLLSWLGLRPLMKATS